MMGEREESKIDGGDGEISRCVGEKGEKGNSMGEREMS